MKKGQLLFELYSPTLVNAQEEYLAALASNNTLLRNASRDRLAALGVTKPGHTAPRKGTRSQPARARVRGVGRRDCASRRTRRYLRHARDRGDVGRQPRSGLGAGRSVRTAVGLGRSPARRRPSNSTTCRARPCTGTVDYVYPELDPKTRTLKVRLRFDNAAKRCGPTCSRASSSNGSADRQHQDAYARATRGGYSRWVFEPRGRGCLAMAASEARGVDRYRVGRSRGDSQAASRRVSVSWCRDSS